MSDARAAPLGALPTSSKVPWTQTLMHSVPLASVWTAVGIWVAISTLCVAYFALFVGGEEGIGSVLFWRDVFTATFVMALVIGYAPAATAYSQRAAHGVLRELRPILRASDAEFQDLARRVVAFSADSFLAMDSFSSRSLEPSLRSLPPSVQPRLTAYTGAVPSREDFSFSSSLACLTPG